MKAVELEHQCSTLEQSLTTASRLGVIYSRVSTIEPEINSYVVQQDAKLTDYCQKNNIEIIGKFVDIGTGGDMERPELQKMLQSLKPGHCCSISSFIRSVSFRSCSNFFLF